MRMLLRLALLAVLLTAGCAGPLTETAAPPTKAPASIAVTSTVGVTQAATEVATTSASVAESQLPPTEAVAPEATATKAPRLALEATDPSTVSLAAGKPQLIEFFAFW